MIKTNLKMFAAAKEMEILAALAYSGHVTILAGNNIV